MKKLILIAILILSGCSMKFTIPDEPRYRDLRAYQLENLVCFDLEGIGILQSNIRAMKEYSDKMRKILEDQNK